MKSMLRKLGVEFGGISWNGFDDWTLRESGVRDMEHRGA